MEKKLKLTDEERATKFHYELNRFNSCMKLYTESMKNAQNIRNRQVNLENNRQSMSNEDHLKDLNLLNDYQIKAENMSKEHFKSAIGSFNMLRNLLK